MNITRIYTPEESASAPSPDDLALATRVLQTNLKLKKYESFLVVTDPSMEKAEAALWFEAGKTLSSHTQMVVFDGMTENAQEPPALVTLMMSKSDVVMLQTRYSLSHTQARKQACAKGARIASLPTVDLEMIRRTLNIDYTPIAATSEKVAHLLSKARTAHITSPGGTDLTLDLKGRDAIADTGFIDLPKSFGNLPAGESFLAPVENTAAGVFVVDASFADITLDQPITIRVEAGKAVAITGGEAATRLNALLDAVGPNARNLGELGVGTNPDADPKGSLIEAEKAYGTVHIALGKNDGFGGTINVPFHSDGVILSPTLTLDDHTILQDGQFLLD